jgi:hypothetical protein
METTATNQQSFWRSVPLLSLGVLIGLLALIAMRMAYYEFIEFQPEMAPGIAIFFMPILLAPLLVVALPLEALLRRLTFKPSSRIQLILVGSTYAFMLSWWAFPDHWWVVSVLNPFFLRWLIGRYGPKHSSMPTPPRAMD